MLHFILSIIVVAYCILKFPQFPVISPYLMIMFIKRHFNVHSNKLSKMPVGVAVFCPKHYKGTIKKIAFKNYVGFLYTCNKNNINYIHNIIYVRKLNSLVYSVYSFR